MTTQRPPQPQDPHDAAASQPGARQERQTQHAAGPPAPHGQAAPAQQASEAWAHPQPASAAPSVAAPRPTGVTVVLVLESIATLVSVLLPVAVSATASAQGGPPPALFVIVFGIIGATMVVRVTALVLVRLGFGWARALYIVAAVVGTIAVIGTAGGATPPIVNLLLLLAIATIVVLFVRSTRTWLRWRSERPTPATRA